MVPVGRALRHRHSSKNSCPHGRIVCVLMNATPGALAWPAALIVWGPGQASTGHSHHCVQLVMAMQGTLRIRGRSGQRWMNCGSALVRPNAARKANSAQPYPSKSREASCVSRQVRLRAGVFHLGAQAHPVKRSSRGGQEMSYCTAGVRSRSIPE
jgi:hypothetical protein